MWEIITFVICKGFSGSSVGKEFACNAADPSLIPWLGGSTGEGIGYPLQHSWVSLVAQLVKNLPAMWDTWVQSLGWVGKIWRREQLPTPVFWPGEFLDCIVHGVAKSQTQMRDFQIHFIICKLHLVEDCLFKSVFSALSA